MPEQGCEIRPQICAKATDKLWCGVLSSSIGTFEQSLEVPSDAVPKPNFEVDLSLHAAPSDP